MLEDISFDSVLNSINWKFFFFFFFFSWNFFLICHYMAWHTVPRVYHTANIRTESENFSALPQETCSALADRPTSVPQNEMDTLTFAGNFPPQPTCIKSSQVISTRPAAVAPVWKEESLTFVGSFTHAPHVTQDQLIALLDSAQTPAFSCGASHGVPPTQSTQLNPSLPLCSNSGTVRQTHPSTSKEVL